MESIHEVGSGIRDRLAAFIERLREQETQRRLILAIVCIALLLDSMLYVVIVPIIPDYLRSEWDGKGNDESGETSNGTSDDNSGAKIGFLFASKAIIQLIVNPFAGTLIDRVGYDIPMIIGLLVMFLATLVYAFGKTYGILFFARSLQGIGSAFAYSSGLAMIADRYQKEEERSKAMGIALAFMSFGYLVAPPFGGIFYEFTGKKAPFIILAFVALFNATLLLTITNPSATNRHWTKEKGTPIYKLILDPYILVAAGALSMSYVPLASLEPTIALWMEDTMHASSWQSGIIWLPAFIPHVIGVVIIVKLTQSRPEYQWLYAAMGLVVIGIFIVIVPFCKTVGVLIIPLCGICFGIALVDTAVLPTLAFLVDVRHVSVYGSVYALADISYCIAYFLGPILAGQIAAGAGFLTMNICLALASFLYAPVLFTLRKVHYMEPANQEVTVLLNEDPLGNQYRATDSDFSTNIKIQSQGASLASQPNGYPPNKQNGNTTFDGNVQQAPPTHIENENFHHRRISRSGENGSDQE
ncbi:probable vesicular acetylcholine transporter-B [Anneissia japonica]|uniref:probable vesicular acetylcholine transporter-B n=1 Tax=Anneissia japonica TaxID=1529436 RepID=UPI0014258CF8|nr:probable vesicular acetylcholine transporter-B [Anneissia japonica]